MTTMMKNQVSTQVSKTSRKMLTLAAVMMAVSSAGVIASANAQATDWMAKANSFASKVASATSVSSATTVKATASQKSFLTSAIQTNLAEIATAQTALQKSANADVKTVAQKMIDEHTAANSKATALAQELNVSVPTSASMTQMAKGKMLSALSGAPFDKLYVRQLVDGHKDAVKLYDKEAKVSADGKVMTYAKDVLPTLQQHLKDAQALELKLKTAA